MIWQRLRAWLAVHLRGSAADAEAATVDNLRTIGDVSSRGLPTVARSRMQASGGW
jgi:hypothetical protein